jgi:hypothetical protein
MAKHWMQKAFKPAHKGELHEDLDVPQGEKIPKKKLAMALAGKKGPKVQQRAQAAKNANP